MKVTALAHTIQGLIKYHGLRNERLRIPYHDSISVCVKALYTIATVEPDPRLAEDVLVTNGREPTRSEASRIRAVVDSIRRAAGTNIRCRIHTRNNLLGCKGLGFSASAFASVGLAAAKALGLNIPLRALSEMVRLGAGSATRSLVGGVAIWYANRHGRSYAEQLASHEDLEMGMVVVPLPLPVETELAHREAVTSPFYRERLKYVKDALRSMRRAIRDRDVPRICELAERDTLNLHAVTMTGRSGLLLLRPESVRVMELVRDLRDKEGLPVWFSLDTGPSVFINTTSGNVTGTARRIGEETGLKVIESEIGQPTHLVEEHLF